MEKIIPNTTQVPNVVFDEWLPNLKDVELRVLLVIIRQTLGWIEDTETGRRKEKDWISRWQLMKKTGRGHSSVSAAVEKLSKNGIIEAYDSLGKLLATPKERSGNKIFYRLNINSNQLNLFSRRNSPVQNVDRLRQPVQNLVVQNSDTTKETQFTKDLNTMRTAKPSASEDKEIKGTSEVDTPNKRDKHTASKHRQFIIFWEEAVQIARRIKPVITGKDAKNLKRILDLGIDSSRLEQAALYFLNHYTFRTFSPSISAFLSSGIINGLLNRIQNDPNFWKELDGFLVRRDRAPTSGENQKQMVEQLSELKKRLASQFAISTTRE